MESDRAFCVSLPNCAFNRDLVGDPPRRDEIALDQRNSVLQDKLIDFLTVL
jgi:hypothetical protein